MDTKKVKELVDALLVCEAQIPYTIRVAALEIHDELSKTTPHDEDKKVICYEGRVYSMEDLLDCYKDALAATQKSSREMKNATHPFKISFIKELRIKFELGLFEAKCLADHIQSNTTFTFYR